MKITHKTLLLTMAVTALAITAVANPLTEGGRLSLEVREVPIATVLSMIAQQNELNIVVSGDLEDPVTLRLDDVDLEDALKAILYPAGYNYYVSNDVIVVKALESDAAGELTSKLITLKYQDPVTVLEALESRSSAKGSMTILDRTQGSTEYTPNQILITDFPDIAEGLVELATELDMPLQMVSIAVKMIETTIDQDTKLGFSWPDAIIASTGSSSSSSSGESSSESDADFTGAWNPNDGSWVWGTLTVAQLNGVLDLLEQNGNSKVVSDPHLTTLEGHQAEIRVETVIPIATINRFTEGAATSDIVTFQDERVGLSVLVTPRINSANELTLDVYGQTEDIIGYAGPVDNQKPITALRSIRTQVTVANGETIVLGGLYKEDEIERVKRFPVLGHIPLLGNLLFTNKSVVKSTTDLTILITPTVLPR